MTAKGRAHGRFRTWPRLSLRSRIVLITVTLLAIGVLISDAAVLIALRGPLVDRVDVQLRGASLILSRLPEPLLHRLGSSAPDSMSGVLDLVDDLYFGSYAPDGTPGTEFRSNVVPALPKLDTPAVVATAGEPFEVDGWRVVAVPRGNPAEGNVVVAASLEQVDATVGRVRALCVLVGLAVLGALALIGWFAVRAGLRPLRRIEETSAAIAGGDLSRRVPVLGGPGTEVGRLADSLNGMLGQIERAVAARAESEARMRRFVADASHEMRTPLAGISGFAELYRMGALAGTENVDATFARIEREAGRLADLVEDLLLLAQLDEGAGWLRPAPMDLRTLAADALHDARALDPGREVELAGLGGGQAAGAPVYGDEARLRQVVSNLVGNAVAHTPAGSPIRIGVGTEGDRSVLEISDRGPGLAPEQAARVFDRFYRADTSRSRNTGGAGLGLSIASSLATAHGGTIELDTAPGEGATFRMVLPRNAS